MLVHKPKADVMNRIDEFNSKLSNTNIKIEKIESGIIVFSNGVVLEEEADIRKFKRRLKASTPVFLGLIDYLYHPNNVTRETAEKEFRTQNARKGGVSVQQKYGNQIKKNLNTGVPWNKDTKGNYPYPAWSKGQTKITNSSLKKLSEDRLGNGNPMYGKEVTQENRNKKSRKMKEMILSGDFTPNSNNRNTHWESSLDGIKYRSSWEALYKYLNPAAKYEKLRIPYEYGIYIVDFIDDDCKIAVEVKPKEQQTGKKFEAKITALKEWCDDNEYHYVLFDQEDVKRAITENDIDYTRFDNNTARKLKGIR